MTAGFVCMERVGHTCRLQNVYYDRAFAFSCMAYALMAKTHHHKMNKFIIILIVNFSHCENVISDLVMRSHIVIVVTVIAVAINITSSILQLQILTDISL